MIQRRLAARAAQHRLRRRRVVTPIDAVHVAIDGHTCANFASNDYLGLTHHPAVLAAMHDAAGRYGAGSGAAGLISGYTHIHQAAERKLAAWKGTEAAILLPSGYQANHAAIQALHETAEPDEGGVRFLLDKLIHASLIGAVRGSGSPFRVFGHNGVAKLRRLLGDAPAGQVQVVVTESIFSMDGDAARLADLTKLKQDFGFLLMLDEAHASGLYGPRGEGLAAEMGLGDAVDLSVVTFSKALGLMGGAVCGSRAMCDLLINHAGAYIYSTSVAPALAAGVMAAIDVIESEPQRRARVRALARRVRTEMGEAGIDIGGAADSPILPWVVGDEQRALQLADRLMEEGMLVVAVRPPTVPPRSSRLRITLSSEHTDREVDRLCAVLRRLGG